MTEEFDLDIQVQAMPDLGEIVILSINGDLDRHNSEIMEFAVNNCYRQRQYHFVVDFTATRRINSTGLGLLINIMDRSRQYGGSIHLIHVPVKIKSLLNHLGVAEDMGICTDLAQALALKRIPSDNTVTIDKEQDKARISYDQ